MMLFSSGGADIFNIGFDNFLFYCIVDKLIDIFIASGVSNLDDYQLTW